MNVPLRLTRDQGSWPRVRLGELAEHRLGKMLDKAKNTGVPRRYLRNPNVRWFDVDISDLQEILVEEKDVHKYELRVGDVLICEGGEAGRAALWKGEKEDIIFQKACHRVRVGPKLDARFLIHRLMYDYFNGGLEDYYTGATIKHFTGQDLARYEIPLPTPDVQRRIVSILDKADALRQMRKRTLGLLERLTQSIFLEMFGDLASNSKGWGETQPLGQLADIVSGITKGRKLNGEVTREVPYLAVSNVQDKFLDLSVVKTIHASENEIERFRLKENDLLLTEGGDPDKLGRGTLWADQLSESIHQNHIFRVRANSPKATPTYLIWLLGSPYGKAYFLRSAKQTTGIASINKRQLSDFPVVLPPVALQVQFEKKAHSVRRLLQTDIQNNVATNLLFSSLQHRAFSGQL